jgi:hypothetical protein
METRRLGRDEDVVPWPSRPPAAEPGEESAQSVLELAQALTDRLATIRVASHHTDTVRLARAMALNVVDLLEGVARR